MRWPAGFAENQLALTFDARGRHSCRARGSAWRLPASCDGRWARPRRARWSSSRRPSSVMPVRAGEVARLADGRLDAELELLGHRDLDLGFLCVGPSTRTWQSALGPTRWTCSSQANWPGCDSSLFGVSWRPGPNRASTSACARWTWWAKSRPGSAGLPASAATSRALRSMAQGFPGHQALIVVGDDQDGDRRIVGR